MKILLVDEHRTYQKTDIWGPRFSDGPKVKTVDNFTLCENKSLNLRWVMGIFKETYCLIFNPRHREFFDKVELFSAIVERNDLPQEVEDWLK